MKHGVKKYVGYRNVIYQKTTRGHNERKLLCKGGNAFNDHDDRVDHQEDGVDEEEEEEEDCTKIVSSSVPYAVRHSSSLSSGILQT